MTESVDALLARLSLSKYAAIFADEAITDVELLTSMGGDLLLENMAEIGVAAADGSGGSVGWQWLRRRLWWHGHEFSHRCFGE